MSAFKQRMIRAFDAAAGYDEAAAIQQQVAASLARRIAALPLLGHARILEVGCGTGLVAAALPRLPDRADWLMTDVSAAMVRRARQRFQGRAGFRFAILDAENPQFETEEGPFDLVCSSLAAQWFEDLPQALERLLRLLKPGGHLLVSTLAEGSLVEWRAAHATLGLEAGTPAYPDPKAFGAMQLGVPAHAAGAWCRNAAPRSSPADAKGSPEGASGVRTGWRPNQLGSCFLFFSTPA
jgi:SAM-dependent methyltransferase